MPTPKQRPAPPEGCLWTSEAAAYLGLSVYALYKWRQRPEAQISGLPQGFKVGGRFVAYSIEEELAPYLERQKRAALQPRAEMRPPEPRISGRRAA